MTEIEQKALALVNEAQEFDCCVSTIYHVHNGKLLRQALCRAIEKHEADKAAHAATIEGILNSHEAYRQKVSDAVEHCRACSDPEAWTRIKFELERFIISKPDPLVEAVGEAMQEHEVYSKYELTESLHKALAKRGLKIVEDV